MPRRVLLATNREIERASLAKVLLDAGHVAHAVGLPSAPEAIRAMHARGETFDSIVVDAAATPAAMQAIMKMATVPGRELPIGVVMMEIAGRSRLESFKDAGFARYLIRPVRPTALLQQVSSEGSTPPVEPRAATSDRPCSLPTSTCETPSRPRLVLIVEDNEINTLLAEKVIERAGHDVLSVGSGREAIEHMRNAIDGAARRPDAILMDIFMPGLDGVETTRRIKALFALDSSLDPEKPCPPIIALTAHAFAEDHERYLESGLDGCLTKPFEPAELQEVLARAFKKSPLRQGVTAA